MRTIVVTHSPVMRRRVLSCLKTIDGIELAGTAPNGRAGLKLCRDTSPQLVVVQFNMPDMTGPALARGIKKGGSDDPAVIILSLRDNPEYPLLASQAHAEGYLPMGWFGEFAPLVRRLVSQRRAMRGLPSESMRDAGAP